MLFLIFCNIKTNFAKLKIFESTYTIKKVFLKLKQVELQEKKDFAIIALNLENKTCIL